MRMQRRKRKTIGPDGAAREPRVNRCVGLLLIDNAPLQAEAWAELTRARRRLEKASREIHRHEETDAPGYRQWLAKLFPALLSRVRELAQQVEAKGRIVEAVEAQAYFSGRRPATVWRAMQNPPKPGKEDPEPPPEIDPEKAEEAAFEDEMKRLFEREGIDENDPAAAEIRARARAMFGFEAARDASPDEAEARAIYRRLVQRLHPDRGGEWTPARARLWEQVQEAWERQDVDCLARLEVEWEASSDVLGPTSALGRLRAACRELDAARRDAERRLRAYRQDHWWRFSLRDPSTQLRDMIGRQLREEEQRLGYHLKELERTIAGWEGARQRKAARKKPLTAAWQDDMPLF